MSAEGLAAVRKATNDQRTQQPKNSMTPWLASQPQGDEPAVEEDDDDIYVVTTREEDRVDGAFIIAELSKAPSSQWLAHFESNLGIPIDIRETTLRIKASEDVSIGGVFAAANAANRYLLAGSCH